MLLLVRREPAQGSLCDQPVGAWALARPATSAAITISQSENQGDDSRPRGAGEPQSSCKDHHGAGGGDRAGDGLLDRKNGFVRRVAREIAAEGWAAGQVQILVV